MDLLRESRYIISSFIIIIVCWLGWLCGLVFGQVGEAFTSAVNFPDVALTCLANLAAFFKVILRDKNWYETYDKHNTMFFSRNVEERIIDGVKVMTTCEANLRRLSVVMLSFHYPATLGARNFMNCISSAFDVHSIFLRCRLLQCGECGAFTEDFRNCRCTENRDGRCGCIVFETPEDVKLMLARRIPGTMKKLPHSQYCLFPSLCCLKNGCHDSNQGLLHVENNGLTESNSQAEPAAAVCEILESIPQVSACICIPLLSANDDEWTNKLITIFEPRKTEFRGVVFRKGGNNVSSALENYKNRIGECDADETYSFASLAIVPHLAALVILFVLTFLFQVDGFSSCVLATRSVQSFLFSEAHQISPEEKLTRARVKSNANNTNVCQVLFFRPYFQPYIVYSVWICSVSICCIGWMVLVGLEGGAHKWYHIQSTAPSEGRIIVIMVAISIAVALDGFDLKLYLQIRRLPHFRRSIPVKIISFRWKSISFHYRVSNDWENIFLFCAIIGLQLWYISFIVRGMGIVTFMDIKFGNRLIYSTLQVLVFVKWYTSFLIMYPCQKASRQGSPIWWYGTCGHYVAASAFLLNATLAGVRAQWKFPWD